MATQLAGETIRFRCDYCPEMFTPEELSDDSSMVWLEAEADGWQNVLDGESWKHCCPKCFEQGKYEADSH